MSSTATFASREKSGPRTPRWFPGRRETRIGIDFGDDSFRLAAIGISPQSARAADSSLKVQWLHRIFESTPTLPIDAAAYLQTLATRLPRFATRGGVSTTIAMPPSAQSLRCVSSTQLAEAERSIAEELGGEIECRSWPVGSQKSMVCGVRRDVAEAIISILGEIGYRCESILPRSISLGRTLLSATPFAEANATVLCWDRQLSLVTMIHDRTIRLCREFATARSQPTSLEQEKAATASNDHSEDDLSQAASDIAEELMLTLQHASRLSHQIMLGPILVCGDLSMHPAALEALRAATRHLFECEVDLWRLNLDVHTMTSQRQQHPLSDVVAMSLAVGGSRLTVGSLRTGGSQR